MTARTLADMTPAEQDQCVGMWCDIPHEYGPAILFIKKNHNLGWGLIAPATNSVFTYLPEDVTPRFDLPRSWTPEGKPVPGEWDDDNGHNAMRRFQSEWEWKHDTPQHIIDQHTKATP